MTMLPDSLAFYTDGGRECIYKQNSCVGSGAGSPFPLPSSFCLETGEGWRLRSHGNQTPGTVEQKMQVVWGPGDFVELPPRSRTADLHISQTYFKNCSRDSVTSSWEQVLTNLGFLWLTLTPAWGQMASLVLLVGRWIIRKGLVAQRPPHLTSKSNSFFS